MRLLFIILALVAAGGTYLYLNGNSSGKAVAKLDKDKAPVPVRVEQARFADLPITLDLVGRGEAYESVFVKARVDGQVQSLHFVEGGPVEQGALLLQLDPADFNARLKQSEANLARDRALRDKARADVVRYRTLRDQGFVSQEKLADLETAATAAEALVEAARATVELARLQHSYTTVRAPIAGLVGVRQVFPGSAVKTNDTVLASIHRVSPLLVSFAVPESHLERLRLALAHGRLHATVRVPDSRVPSQPASIHFVDNAVDPGTGTLLIKARLDNRDQRLSPGQYLRVSLVLDTLRKVVTVPAEAIQQGPKGAVVYVVTGEQGVRIAPVRIAAEHSGRVALSQGIQAGETVVVDGHLRLTPKSKVKIAEDPQKPTSR